MKNLKFLYLGLLLSLVPAFAVNTVLGLDNAIVNANNANATITFTGNIMDFSTLGRPLRPCNTNASFAPLNAGSYTIDGANFTIIGGAPGTFGGFFIDGGNITIQNLTFDTLAAVGGKGGVRGGGGAGMGGAIFVNSNAVLQLTDVHFTGCSSTGGGVGSATGNGGGGGLFFPGGNDGFTTIISGGGGGGFGGAGARGGILGSGDNGGGGGGGCGFPGQLTINNDGGDGGGDFFGNNGSSGGTSGNPGAASNNGGGAGGGGLNGAGGTAAASKGAGGGGGGFGNQNGGAGSDFGGGGGSSATGNGGDGGYGGGGGGTSTGTAGNGGFGGGGGTSTGGTIGTSLFAGGSGAGGFGGSGAGLGGAIFIRGGATCTITLTNTYTGNLFNGGSGTNSATGGPGSNPGQGLGNDIFMESSAQLNFDLNTDLTISSNIESDQGAGGSSTTSGGITKQGPNKLTLLGTNTYTGKTTISTGTLSVSADTNLGASSTTIALADTLEVTNSFSTARDVDLVGNATIDTATGVVLTSNGMLSGSNATLIKTGLGDLTLTGDSSATLTSNSFNLQNGNLQISNLNQLGDNAATIQFNGGTLNPTAGLNFGGTYTISLDAAGSTSTINNANTLTIGTPISGAAGNGFTKTGAGALILAAANTFDGPVTVNQGTLVLNGSGVLGTGSMSNFTLNGTSFLLITAGVGSKAINGAFTDNTNAAINITDNTLQLSSGNVLGTITGAAGSVIEKIGTGAVNYRPTSTTAETLRVTAGTLDIEAAPPLGSNVAMNGGNLSVSNNAVNYSGTTFALEAANSTITTNANFTIGAVVSGAAGNGFTKEGNNNLILTSANTFDGPVIVNAGTLQLSGTGTLGNGSMSDLALNGTSILSLATGAGSKALNGVITDNANTQIQLNNNTLQIAQGSVQSTITGTTGSVIEKISGGVVGFSPATMGAEILRMTSGTLEVASGASLGSNIAMNGGVLRTTSAGVNYSGTTFVLEAANSTLESNSAFTISTPISGLAGNGFTKEGGSNLILTAANTFNGPVVVNNGELVLMGAGTLGAGSMSNFTLNNASVLSVASGAGVKAINGSFTDVAATTVQLNNNILQLSSGTVVGMITGTAGSVIEKIGTGTLTYTPATTTAEFLRISDGTLDVNALTSLGSNIQMNGGNLQISTNPLTYAGISFALGDINSTITTNADLTINTVITGAAGNGFTKNGASTLTLGATNTFNGPVVINAGVLQVSGAGTLGSGSQSDLSVRGTSSFVVPVSFGTIQIEGSLTGVSTGIIALNDNTLEVGAGSFPGAITASPSSVLRKISTGTLILSGSNAAETLRLSNGIFETSNAGSLSANITFDGGSLRIPAANPVVFSGTQITLGIANSTITANNTFTINTPIQGAAGNGFTVDGIGSVVLGMANTFDGPVVVNSGNVTLNTAGNLGTGSNGDLTLNGTGSFSIVPGAVTKAINGVLTGSIGSQINLDSNILQVNQGNFAGTINASPASVLNKLSSGQLTLSGTNNAGTLQIDDGSVLVTNAQAMGQSVSLNGGLLRPTASFTNTTDISVDASSQLDVPTGITITQNGDLLGSSSLVKQGSGVLAINGNKSGNSSLSIAGGEVNLAGNFPTPTTMSANTRLTGNGTIDSITNNGGTISPGPSIQTIQVSNNFSSDTNSTLDVDITCMQEVSDKVVVGGTATIDGGVVNITPAPGNYLAGTQWTIITGNTVVNTLPTINVIGNNFLQFELVEGSLILQLLNDQLFQGMNIDPGPAQSVVNCLLTFQDIDQQTPFGQYIELLGTLPDSELNQQLVHMSPASFGAVEWINLDNNSLVAQLIANHVFQLSCSKRNCKISKVSGSLIVQGYGDFAKSDQQQNLRGYHANTGGAFSAYDLCFNRFHVGFGFNYNYTNFLWDALGGKGKINSYGGIVYSSYSGKEFTLDASILAGGNDYRITRRLFVSNSGMSADLKERSDHIAGFFSAHLGGKLDASSAALHIQPFGNLDYHYLNQEPFTERGDQAALKIRQRISNMMRTELGCNFTGVIKTVTGCIAPYAALSWVRKISLNRGLYKGRFVGESCDLSALSFYGFRDFISPQAGIKVTNTNGFNAQVGYTGEFNGKNNVHQAEANLEWIF